MKSIAVFALAVLALTPALRGQSLADVAKAEEARRKSVTKPAKVYTNEDLKVPDQSATRTPAPPSSSAAPATPTEAATPAAADSAKKDEQPVKDQKYWKDRMTTAQSALDRDRVLADAVQSRINALTTDFVNTSDPAQRAVVEQNRKTALTELDRLNKDIKVQTQAVADIQEEARKASVPAGWLR